MEKVFGAASEPSTDLELLTAHERLVDKNTPQNSTSQTKKSDEETSAKLTNSEFPPENASLTSDLRPGNSMQPVMDIFLSRLEDRMIRMPSLEPAPYMTADLAKEEHALFDVYNYAARHGYMPNISFTSQPSGFIKVDLELPEHGIAITEVRRNSRQAEMFACIRFKEAAERYQAAEGTGILSVKDMKILNTDNAEDFVNFYRHNHRTKQISININCYPNYWEAQGERNSVPIGPKVQRYSKTGLEDLVYLTMALSLAKETPKLLPNFLAQLDSRGRWIKTPGPVKLELTHDSISLMKETLDNARKAGLVDVGDEVEAEDEAQEVRRIWRKRQLTTLEEKRRSYQLQQMLQRYNENHRLADLRAGRAGLPMSQRAAEVLNIVENNPVSIIIGETGSGKTTQVPQIILDHATESQVGASCNIICTQPRRMSATSVAQRVSQERAQDLQDQVGYHIRFDAKLPRPGGSITFCTNGILLRQLQHNPDVIMDTVSHLLIDEVHVRELNSDFLLIILKKTLARRIQAGKRIPKIVFMSATIDSELFSNYFENMTADGVPRKCPTLFVPGRSFPVKEIYLDDILESLYKENKYELKFMSNDRDTVKFLRSEQEFEKLNCRTAIDIDVQDGEEEKIIDWSSAPLSRNEVSQQEKEAALLPNALVVATIAHLSRTTENGAILVFLPGLDTMLRVQKMLQNDSILGVNFNDDSKYKLYMLHSAIPDEQKEVFQPVSTQRRKIILATNIAESSITIPEVAYVVDLGKVKEARYDQFRRISVLESSWISKANLKQRAGRAGRVQNGHYYALFSKARRDSLRATGAAELCRSDLLGTCLSIKAHGFNESVGEFLADALEPPPPKAVSAALNDLIELDAFTDNEVMTPLGRLLSSLPIHPGLGKMIILAIIFRCLDPVIIIAAALEEPDIIASPLGSRRQAEARRVEFANQTNSDHIAVLNAFCDLRDILSTEGETPMLNFARENFLRVQGFRNISRTAKAILEIFTEVGLIPKDAGFRGHRGHRARYGNDLLNENSDQVELVKAILVSGLSSNIAKRAYGKTYRTSVEPATKIHPASVNSIEPAMKFRPEEEAAARRPSLIAYSSLRRSADGNHFLNSTTEITALMATLFGGPVKLSGLNQNNLIMDWLPFNVIKDRESPSESAATIVLKFRQALERMKTQAFNALTKREYLAENEVGDIFSKALVKLLNQQMDFERFTERTDAQLLGGLLKEFFKPTKKLALNDKYRRKS